MIVKKYVIHISIMETMAYKTHPEHYIYTFRGKQKKNNNITN